MKSKRILGLVIAFLVAVIASNLVMATLPVSIDRVTVNDVDDSEGLVLAGPPSDSIDVEVKFTAEKDLSDLKLRVWVEGYKADISESTARFAVKNGSTYIKRLSLTLPNVKDLKDDLSQDLTLHVRIASRTDEVEDSFEMSVERESYAYEVLSVETVDAASAGEIIALDVVLKNIGAEELEDSFITASIPELGVYRRVYFGDLTANDDADRDKEDARERRLYVVIPSSAKTGDYTLEVRASNYETSVTTRKVISVKGMAATEDKDGEKPVDGDNEEGIPTSILVLTIVLVVIFVVLLIVLIVLLTRRPAEKSEDFGETSYY